MKQYPVRRKLLIIDDDEATRLHISEVLSDTFLEIIEACRGEEAIRLFKEYSTELALVFIDVKLPDCYGWDLVPVFRSEDCSIPLITISATVPDELKEKSEELGIDFYLSKPFDIKAITQSVACCLKQKFMTI